jgi:hypothetical protein
MNLPADFLWKRLSPAVSLGVQPTSADAAAALSSYKIGREPRLEKKHSR